MNTPASGLRDTDEWRLFAFTTPTKGDPDDVLSSYFVYFYLYCIARDVSACDVVKDTSLHNRSRIPLLRPATFRLHFLCISFFFFFSLPHPSTMTAFFVASLCLLVQYLPSTQGFTPSLSLERAGQSLALHSSLQGDDNDDDIGHDDHQLLFSRRKALQTAALLTSSSFLPSTAANAQETTLIQSISISSSAVGVDCLKDLPLFDPTTTVRIYLARHGETDNNKYNKLQGARIDAPINSTGERQALLLGQALARAGVQPEMVLHSPLQRARQTAQIAAQQVYANSSSPLQKTQSLDALVELDFGEAAEGEPVEARRVQRIQTYAAWAMGNLDTRMATGGESGREVSVAVVVVVVFASTAPDTLGRVSGVFCSKDLPF